ncbi:hypothetical protein JTB14_027167 [Gonioctena quinquepunctata]|nr:hypothetical protein JTB14_027167 [Gonioctena quinquepunctata]
MKTITPKTKPNSESQVPTEREISQSGCKIDDKNDNAYDNFVEAKKRHRRNKSLGTNSISEAEERGFEGRDNMLPSNKNKKIWLFISRMEQEHMLRKLLRKKLETFHKTKDNNCFLVGVNPSMKDIVYRRIFGQEVQL